eukprot:6192147-Pleurochrysis_carterae.AAC.7
MNARARMSLYESRNGLEQDRCKRELLLENQYFHFKGLKPPWTGGAAIVSKHVRTTVKGQEARGASSDPLASCPPDKNVQFSFFFAALRFERALSRSAHGCHRVALPAPRGGHTRCRGRAVRHHRRRHRLRARHARPDALAPVARLGRVGAAHAAAAEHAMARAGRPSAAQACGEQARAHARGLPPTQGAAAASDAPRMAARRVDPARLARHRAGGRRQLRQGAPCHRRRHLGGGAAAGDPDATVRFVAEHNAAEQAIHDGMRSDMLCLETGDRPLRKIGVSPL